MTLDPEYVARIGTAIAQVNTAAASGLSPMVHCMDALEAIALLQNEIWRIVEAEQKRTDRPRPRIGRQW